MQEITYRVKLNIKQEDCQGYITYVFENLEATSGEDKYIMCVQFPNWEQSIINIDDIGYLKFREVEEGIDKWYDGTDLIPYKYTNIIFLKFILDKPIVRDKIILD